MKDDKKAEQKVEEILEEIEKQELEEDAELKALKDEAKEYKDRWLRCRDHRAHCSIALI